MSEVRLREITEEDTEIILKWRNDLYVRSMLFGQAVVTKEMHTKYFREQIKTGKIHQFIIEIIGDKEKIKAIGSTFLKNIDKENRKCEFGIFIGENEGRGHGYGTEAVQYMIRYAFEVLNMHRVYLEVLCNNSSAIAAYKKAGFIEEGVLHDAYRRDGMYYDVTIMGIVDKK